MAEIINVDSDSECFITGVSTLIYSDNESERSNSVISRLTDNTDDTSVSSKNLYDSYPLWIEDFDEKCLEIVGTKCSKKLDNLMNKYLIYMKREQEYCQRSPSRSNHVAKQMYRCLTFFYMYYQDTKDYFITSQWIDNMVQLLVIYCKLEIKSATRLQRGKENDNMIATRIMNLMWITLENNDTHMLHVLLKMVRDQCFTKRQRGIFEPIFRKLLTTKRPRDGSDLEYIRIILTFKTWKRLLYNDEKKEISKMCFNSVKQPPGFERNYRRYVFLPTLPNTHNLHEQLITSVFDVPYTVQNYFTYLESRNIHSEDTSDHIHKQIILSNDYFVNFFSTEEDLTDDFSESCLPLLNSIKEETDKMKEKPTEPSIVETINPERSTPQILDMIDLTDEEIREPPWVKSIESIALQYTQELVENQLAQIKVKQIETEKLLSESNNSEETNQTCSTNDISTKCQDISSQEKTVTIEVPTSSQDISSSIVLSTETSKDNSHEDTITIETPSSSFETVNSDPKSQEIDTETIVTVNSPEILNSQPSSQVESIEMNCQPETITTETIISSPTNEKDIEGNEKEKDISQEETIAIESSHIEMDKCELETVTKETNEIISSPSCSNSTDSETINDVTVTTVTSISQGEITSTSSTIEKVPSEKVQDSCIPVLNENKSPIQNESNITENDKSEETIATEEYQGSQELKLLENKDRLDIPENNSPKEKINVIKMNTKLLEELNSSEKMVEKSEISKCHSETTSENSEKNCVSELDTTIDNKENSAISRNNGTVNTNSELEKISENNNEKHDEKEYIESLFNSEIRTGKFTSFIEKLTKTTYSAKVTRRNGAKNVIPSKKDNKVDLPLAKPIKNLEILKNDKFNSIYTKVNDKKVKNVRFSDTNLVQYIEDIKVNGTCEESFEKKECLSKVYKNKAIVLEKHPNKIRGLQKNHSKHKNNDHADDIKKQRDHGKNDNKLEHSEISTESPKRTRRKKDKSHKSVDTQNHKESTTMNTRSRNKIINEEKLEKEPLSLLNVKETKPVTRSTNEIITEVVEHRSERSKKKLKTHHVVDSSTKEITETNKGKSHHSRRSKRSKLIAIPDSHDVCKVKIVKESYANESNIQERITPERITEKIETEKPVQEIDENIMSDIEAIIQNDIQNDKDSLSDQVIKSVQASFQTDLENIKESDIEQIVEYCQNESIESTLPQTTPVVSNSAFEQFAEQTLNKVNKKDTKISLNDSNDSDVISFKGFSRTSIENTTYRDKRKVESNVQTYRPAKIFKKDTDEVQEDIEIHPKVYPKVRNTFNPWEKYLIKQFGFDTMDLRKLDVRINLEKQPYEEITRVETPKPILVKPKTPVVNTPYAKETVDSEMIKLLQLHGSSTILERQDYVKNDEKLRARIERRANAKVKFAPNTSVQRGARKGDKEEKTKTSKKRTNSTSRSRIKKEEDIPKKYPGQSPWRFGSPT